MKWAKYRQKVAVNFRKFMSLILHIMNLSIFNSVCKHSILIVQSYLLWTIQKEKSRFFSDRWEKEDTTLITCYSVVQLSHRHKK